MTFGMTLLNSSRRVSPLLQATKALRVSERHNSTLSRTSALDGSGGSAPRPGRLIQVYFIKYVPYNHNVNSVAAKARFLSNSSVSLALNIHQTYEACYKSQSYYKSQTEENEMGRACSTYG